MARVFIGTSGWNYKHWKGIFYPAGLSAKQWLGHYTDFFNSIELNVTFYRLVPKDTFKKWFKQTPEEFCFVVKGSRFITHIKRLKGVNEPVDLFFKNVSGLGKKTGVILWQFPPGFRKDLRRLEDFLRLLKKTKIRQAFEFRHTSWFEKDVYAILKKYNACLCIAHSGGRYPCIRQVTADFIYLRFHGDALYSSNYPGKELKKWASFAKKFSKDLYVFFNNDACAYAVKNALEFKKFIGK